MEMPFSSGNFLGRKPYIAGSSCSACPKEMPYCSDNLCSKFWNFPCYAVQDNDNYLYHSADIKPQPADVKFLPADPEILNVVDVSRCASAALNVHLLLGLSFVTLYHYVIFMQSDFFFFELN